MMIKSEQLTARPIVVWENAKADGGQEATVQELHTGGETGSNMPVIRIVSSGFGTPQAVKNSVQTVNQLSNAA